MASNKHIETYKGFDICEFTRDSNGSRKGELCIAYPDGEISKVIMGSIEAAKRIIDTHENSLKQHELVYKKPSVYMIKKYGYKLSLEIMKKKGLLKIKIPNAAA